MGGLLARAKFAGDADGAEAMLAEAARRASAFQEELDKQRCAAWAGRGAVLHKRSVQIKVNAV